MFTPFRPCPTPSLRSRVPARCRPDCTVALLSSAASLRG